MFGKIKQYYNCFGFKETVKKVIRYTKFVFRSRFNDNGVYALSKKEKENVVLKSKSICFLANESYNDQDPITKEFISDLNSMGFMIDYYSCENQRVKNVPLSIHKNIDEFVVGDADLIIVKDRIERSDVLKLVADFNKTVCLLTSADEIDESLLKTVYKIIVPNEELKNKLSVLMPDREIMTLGKDNIVSELSLFGSIDKEFYDNISVVVLNYNNKNVIQKCLDSLLKYNYRYNYEIVVVDNNSSDGSYEIIKKNYKEVRLYRNEKNGCSSGRNIGIEKSKGEYIVFLDSDQWVCNEYWLDNFLDIISEKSIGAVGWTGGWFNSNGYAYHTVDNFEYRYMPPQCLYRKDIGYLGAGGLLVSKEVLEKIHGFDTMYDPTCYEDTDISLKIRHYGKETVYSPYMGIKHLPHQTTKSGSAAHEQLIKKKGDYFVEKWKSIDPDLLKFRK